MNRIELLRKINQHKARLASLGVKRLLIGRECSLEKMTDSKIPLLIKVEHDTYETYNSVEEYLVKNIYEYIEVIPADSFEAAIDDHFGVGAFNIEF